MKIATRTGRSAGLWSDRLGAPATRALQVLILLALAACVVFAMMRLKLLVIPLLIAVILAAALAPVVRYLKRHGWPPLLATWTTLLGALGLLSLIIWLVGREFRDEWPLLVEEAGRGLDELERFATEGPIPISEAQLEQARQAATQALTSDAVQAGAVRGATAAIEAVAGLFLGLVVLFFLLKDGRKIYSFLLTPLQPYTRQRALRIGDRSVDVLGGYVRGTAIIAFVDAFFIGLALVILGVPLALPLAIVVFLGAFIPLIGAVLAGVLAALVALVTNGPVTALIVVAVIIGVNQLEGDLLAPVIMGRVLALHPLAVLLALTAGTILAGFVGALLAVPIAAVSWAAIKEWVATSPSHEVVVAEAEPPPDEG
ncbi:AI-2E family transporter [Isoptericola variabilis]|uniref:AI-2E family transporter n=1 Tax=Isoptericola variabilis (strain 225) TaxID=743718 RepID=F6FRP3_ISOV2|nr:AI-2E family transporter [Isoptericola variabilis]AEG42984.1 protein of unknown function UPF0118 [Isoptericola variabilis 225]TWH30044.1 putative PurR-regulated permease PerM [Isoptericola variabilis J7]